MRKTNFYAELDLFDTTASSDANYSSDDNSSLGNLNYLREYNENTDKYPSFEKNFFVFNQRYTTLSTSSRIAFYSKQQSNEYGLFDNNPKITITFTNTHSSNGLSLYFLEDYPLEMIITWYTLDGTRIVSETTNPDSKNYVFIKKVEDYGKITLEFTKARPYRNIKLQRIEYGTKLIFGSSDSKYSLKNAKLITSTDAISDKIAINKLSFSIIDDTNNFNFGNLNGIHSLLQNGQVCNAWEEIDGEKKYLGVYFLTKWNNKSNVASLEFQDYKGLLSNYTFRSGRIHDGDTAGEILEAIFYDAHIDNFEIDAELYDIPLYGYLKIQDCKSALREVLFACGATVKTYGYTCIYVEMDNKRIVNNIQRDRKFSTSTSTYDYVSSVSIKYPIYELESEIKEVYKAFYNIGTYTIDFSVPYQFTGITGAKMIDYNQHSVKFEVTTPSEIVIKGKAYKKEEVTIKSSVDAVSTGEKEKDVTYSCQVINYALAKSIADNILNYLQQRLKVNSRFLCGDERDGKWVEIENENKKYSNYATCIEELSLDLTGGFIATAKCRGYNKVNYYWGYATEDVEIYTGEVFNI